MMYTKTADQLTYSQAAMEDRCAAREKISIAAMLRPSGDPGFRVEIIDISIAGFACKGVSGMRAGARCWLTLPGLAGLQSEVVWNDLGVIGCSFSNLLHQAVLDSVLRRARGC